jgi:hypothetical protein
VNSTSRQLQEGAQASIEVWKVITELQGRVGKLEEQLQEERIGKIGLQSTLDNIVAGIEEQWGIKHQLKNVYNAIEENRQKLDTLKRELIKDNSEDYRVKRKIIENISFNENEIESLEREKAKLEIKLREVEESKFIPSKVRVERDSRSRQLGLMSLPFSEIHKTEDQPLSEESHIEIFIEEQEVSLANNSSADIPHRAELGKELTTNPYLYTEEDEQASKHWEHSQDKLANSIHFHDEDEEQRSKDLYRSRSQDRGENSEKQIDWGVGRSLSSRSVDELGPSGHDEYEEDRGEMYKVSEDEDNNQRVMYATSIESIMPEDKNSHKMNGNSKEIVSKTHSRNSSVSRMRASSNSRHLQFTETFLQEFEIARLQLSQPLISVLNDTMMEERFQLKLQRARERIRDYKKKLLFISNFIKSYQTRILQEEMPDIYKSLLDIIKEQSKHGYILSEEEEEATLIIKEFLKKYSLYFPNLPSQLLEMSCSMALKDQSQNSRLMLDNSNLNQSLPISTFKPISRSQLIQTSHNPGHGNSNLRRPTTAKPILNDSTNKENLSDSRHFAQGHGNSKFANQNPRTNQAPLPTSKDHTGTYRLADSVDQISSTLKLHSMHISTGQGDKQSLMPRLHSRAESVLSRLTSGGSCAGW